MNFCPSHPVKCSSHIQFCYGPRALDAAAGDENISFAITNNSKVIAIDANDATGGGGAAGSVYTFTYFGANTVFVEAHALVTTGTPAPDAASTSATGI